MNRTKEALLVFALLSALALPCGLRAQTVEDATLASVNLDPNRLRVHFIDIGPGLAMLIETPGDDVHVFVDGGKWGLDEMMTYLEHFVGAAVESIDIAIVTHPDFDHFAGMRRVFAKYEVRQFWYTGYDSPELSGSWRDFLKDVESENDCQLYLKLEDWVSVGDTEALDDGGTAATDDDVLVRYLNIDSDPPERDPIFGRRFSESERRNNASLVVKLVYGDVSFLITGDINGRNKEHEGAAFDQEIDSEELELWVRHTLDPSRYSLSSTVLQLPHHGSSGSSSVPFLQAVSPAWVVIPAGHEFNHPTPDTLRRIGIAGIPESRVLRTDRGDSTPETRTLKDPRGDESYVFESDGRSITRIVRVRMQ